MSRIAYTIVTPPPVLITYSIGGGGPYIVINQKAVGREGLGKMLGTSTSSTYPLILQLSEAVHNDTKHNVQPNGCHNDKVRDIQE